MSPAMDHPQIRMLLPFFANGLLSELESAPVEEHLQECDECRADLSEMRRTIDRHDGHLPARLISHWPDEKGVLRGLYREIVRRHLEECASCPELIRDFGHDPVLESVPSLESNDALIASLPETELVVAKLAPPEKHRDPERLPWYREVRGLWVGTLGGGGLVAAAAALLIVFGALRIPAGGPETTPVPLPLPRSSLQLSVGAQGEPAWLAARDGSDHARGPSRSGPDSVIRLRPGQNSIRIAVMPRVDLPVSTPVLVEMVDSSGQVLDSAPLLFADLVSGERGLFLSSTTPLEPGRFTIRLRWERGDGSRGSAEYPLELRK